jgi:hypothetical protein
VKRTSKLLVLKAEVSIVCRCIAAIFRAVVLSNVMAFIYIVSALMPMLQNLLYMLRK